MRLSHIKKAILVVAFASLIIGKQNAQDFSQVEIKTIKITNNMYMLMGAGGNIGILVGEDGVLMIDSQFAQLKDKIQAAISELNEGPVKFLLNTNWHYDHSFGNAAWAEEGAVIIAHKNTRRQMLQEWTLPELDPALKIPPFPKAALPVITVTDSMLLHFNSEEIQLIHFPNAHSEGDLAFYFPKANVIHTGDLYFSDGFPFINISSGGSIDGMIKSATKITDMIGPETKVIPGHGPLSNRQELLAYRDMLTEAKAVLFKLIKEGESLEQITAQDPVAKLYKRGESSFPTEIFIKVMFMELTKE